MAELIFDHARCTLCGQCVAQCPFRALQIENKKVEVTAGCRMCKLCIKNCPAGAISLQEDEEKKTVDKSAWRGILVFAQREPSGLHPVVYELLGKAQELAGRLGQPVYALLVGAAPLEAEARELLRWGADQVLVYEHPELEAFRGDVYANLMEDCINRVLPSVVLVGATALGRSLAPACATRFRTGLTADCTMLDIKENTDLIQVRPAFGGNIMARIVTAGTRPQFATVRYKVMNAKRRDTAEGGIVPCEVTPQMLRSGMQVLATEVTRRRKSIEEEDALVVAGRGVKKQEDMEMLLALAKALGGQLAATRPLVERGWADVTAQVGLSGRTVRPKLIITCGVSGAVQFAAGMDQSECIVAINTDAEAPIFRIAHYGIVADLYEVVPELTAAVQAHRQRFDAEKKRERT